MKILTGIVFYIFAVVTMAGSALYRFRNNSKEMRMAALIIGEIVIHIGLIIMFWAWLND